MKTPADVDRTFAAGFCFFTIDPSDAVDAKADNYSADVLQGPFAEVRDEIDWFDKYSGKQVKLASGTTIDLDEEAVMRAAVKYGRALNRGIELADYIRKVNEQGRPRLRDRAARSTRRTSPRRSPSTTSSPTSASAAA